MRFASSRWYRAGEPEVKGSPLHQWQTQLHLEEGDDVNIGIIGSGNIGGTLARQLTALGHHVFIGNSRGPASLTALAAETGATAATVEQAAGAGDVVIIAVPEKA